MIVSLPQDLLHRLPLGEFIDQFIEISKFLHQRFLDVFDPDETPGWLSLGALSAETGIDIQSVLKLFMTRRLRRVGIVKNIPFLYGLRFERMELIGVLTGVASPMSLLEVSNCLEISTRAAKHLGESGHLEMFKPPYKARRVQVFDRQKVAEFHATYTSWNVVRRLARHQRYGSEAQLRLLGLSPAIASHNTFGANAYYARSEVRAVFGPHSV